MKTSFRPGLKFGENQVIGRVSILHYTWLVPRTRASSDDVNGFLTLRQAAKVLGQEFLDQISPEGLVPRGTEMPYSAAVDLVARLGVSQKLYNNGPKKYQRQQSITKY
ncbi:hypothetical protein M9H77_09587 [Catharanthus roseus]|uniref:Uncharacterized protein n=1 Tax=Catharanthus roseus TaxID=4058 RepID=A0ACC0C103_CATRO|nr:hypothetical protein M9H77_09587 [Catharanthus roseus]